MNTIKANWKVILICILMLFSVSKCTQSCNRDSEINRVNVVCDSLQHHIAVDQKIIDSLIVAHKQTTDSMQFEITARDMQIQSLGTLNSTILQSNKTLTDVAKDAARRQTSIQVITDKENK